MSSPFLHIYFLINLLRSCLCQIDDSSPFFPVTFQNKRSLQKISVYDPGIYSKLLGVSSSAFVGVQYGLLPMAESNSLLSAAVGITGFTPSRLLLSIMLCYDKEIICEIIWLQIDRNKKKIKKREVTYLNT